MPALSNDYQGRGRLIRFINGTTCDEGRLLKADLWVDGNSGLIVESPLNNNDGDYTTVDLEGLIVSPGFLDIQINGAFGLDFSDTTLDEAKYAKEFSRVGRQLLKSGVTGFCPTLTSSFPSVYQRLIPTLGDQRTIDRADSLGAHVEGPFLSKEKPGCHPMETLVEAPDGYESFVSRYGGEENLSKIRILTLAPELEGCIDAIPDLISKHGIKVSVGHTMARYETAVKAVHQGANMVTHMYNAMPQPHHREPGPFGLLGLAETTTLRRPYFGLVADGIHVHPATINIAYNSHPEGAILVTDAMYTIGLPDGSYKWVNGGGKTIVKRGSVLKLENTNTIAGSATELDECIRNLIHWANIPLAKAIQTVTNNPARALGLEHQRGFLKPGCYADLTIVDSEGYVHAVYKGGRKANIKVNL